MNSRQPLNEQHEILSFLHPSDFSDFNFAQKCSLRDLIPTILYAYLEFSIRYFDNQNLILNFRAFLLNKNLWNRTVEEMDYIIGNTIAHKIEFLNTIYVNFFEDLKRASDAMSSSKDFSEKNVLFHLMKSITVALEFNVVIFNKNRKKIIHRSAENYFCIPIFRRKGSFYILHPTSLQYLQTIYTNFIEKSEFFFLHCGHSSNEINKVSNSNICCRICGERLYQAEIKINCPNQNTEAYENVYQITAKHDRYGTNSSQKGCHEEKKVYKKVEPNLNKDPEFDEPNKNFKCANCNGVICLYCSVSNKNFNEDHKNSNRRSGYKCRNCKKEFSKEVKSYIKKMSDHYRAEGMPDRFHPNMYCPENFISEQ